MQRYGKIKQGDIIMNFVENKVSVWDIFKSTDKPIILYGMGDGADKVINEFNKLNIKFNGVMASDDFVRGQTFHGFTVKKLRDFEEELGDFLIALCFASQIPEVTDNINSIAKKHTLLVPSVPVYGNNIFNKNFYEANQENFNRAYELLEDDTSRKVFINIINFQYTGDIKYLDECTTEKDEIFNNILKFNDNEIYLDLGAYNGDTIEEFLSYCKNRYKSIIAFEPNSKNFSKLQKKCADLKNISLWQIGSYSKNTIINFNNKAGRNSAISEKGTPTQTARADTILCGQRVTYAKLDVEGAEKETIIGMEQTIKLFAPKLNVAAYHRSEDLFALILQIHKLNPNYKFYLRHHPYIPHWDTNLYCI